MNILFNFSYAILIKSEFVSTGSFLHDRSYCFLSLYVRVETNSHDSITVSVFVYASSSHPSTLKYSTDRVCGLESYVVSPSSSCFCVICILPSKQHWSFSKPLSHWKKNGVAGTDITSNTFFVHFIISFRSAHIVDVSMEVFLNIIASRIILFLWFFKKIGQFPCNKIKERVNR